LKFSAGFTISDVLIKAGKLTKWTCTCLFKGTKTGSCV